MMDDEEVVIVEDAMVEKFLEVISIPKVLFLVYAVGCLGVLSVLAIPLFTPLSATVACREDRQNWVYVEDVHCSFVEKIGVKILPHFHAVMGIDVTFKSWPNFNISTCRIDVTSSWTVLHSTMCSMHSDQGNSIQCFTCLHRNESRVLLPPEMDLYIYLRCDSQYHWPFRLYNTTVLTSPYFHIYDNVYYSFDTQESHRPSQRLHSIEQLDKPNSNLYKITPQPFTHMLFDP